MEKLVKATDGLRLAYSNNNSSSGVTEGGGFRRRESAVTVKEKMSLCHQISHLLISQTLRTQTDYGKQFSVATEVLFLATDDSSADVRLVAEESLNVVFRNLISDGNSTRIHVELYRELKRNGSSRALRAALSRFSELASLIRPNKSRMFAVSLGPCLIAIAKRPEEAVQECLGSCVDKIFRVLSPFFSDEETKKILKCSVQNLQLQSTVSRRTASAMIYHLCKHSRKRIFFTNYVFKGLLDILVPVQFDLSVPQVLGALLSLRLLIPLVKHILDSPECDKEAEQRMTDKGTLIKLNQPTRISEEQLLLLYEVTLHHACSSHNSVITAALETLVQLLTHTPRALLVALRNPSGIAQSRIYIHSFNPRSGHSRQSSLSGIRSGMSSLGGSQTDLSLGINDFTVEDSEPLFGIKREGSNLSQMSASPLDAGAGVTFHTDRNEQTLSDEIGAVVNLESNLDTVYTGIDIGESELKTNHELPKSESENEIFDPLRYLDLGKSEILDSGSDMNTPLMSPVYGESVSFPPGIGNFVDTEASLIYCSRLLAARFLLSGQSGETVPDKDVRVSHKSLALACLSSVVSLHPTVLKSTLYKSDPERGGQSLKDVFFFSDHSDPQLRGCVASLCGAWLGAAFAGNGMSWKNLGVVDHSHEAVTILSAILDDGSAVAVRAAVEAIRQARVAVLTLEDGKWGLEIMRKLLKLASNPYWLVKVSLVDVLAEMDYCLLRAYELRLWGSDIMQQQCIECLLSVLLSDADSRVRHAVGSSLSKFVKKLCFDNDPELGRIMKSMRDVQSFDSNEDYWIHESYPRVHSLVFPYSECRKTDQMERGGRKEGAVGLLVNGLVSRITVASGKYELAGCVEALLKLALKFPPTVYRCAWSVDLEMSITGSVGLLSLLIQMLASSSLAFDLTAFQHTLRLTSVLFGGFAMRESEIQKKNRGDKWPLLISQGLQVVANDLLMHCLRLMNVYWYIITEQIPGPPPMIAKPQLPPLPQAPSLSPMKRQLKGVTGGLRSPGWFPEIPEANANSVQNVAPAPPPAPVQSTKTKLGDCYSSPYFMRMYEILKGAHNNYRNSLDESAGERFVGVLRECLLCLGRVLEMGSIGDVGVHVEEFLVYLKSTMSVLPSESVLCVTQLLKALFGTNLSIICISKEAASSHAPVGIPVACGSDGLYQECLMKERKTFSQYIGKGATRQSILESLIKNHLGWLGIRSEKYVLNLLKNSANKNALTSYIRLFEPVVVQTLKLYTSSVGLDLQRAVLGLLTQLVTVRVNYCLLDTDQRFLNFLYQQLEAVEEGNFRKPEELVPSIFEFLLLLSYEKSKNNPIVEIPKILQLCDGLMASGQDPDTIVMKVLHSVICDLYFVRPSAKLESAKELEIQQEVATSMLMKYIHEPTAQDLLTLVLYQLRKENEGKWRKLSRDVADKLIPCLEKNKGMTEWRALKPVLSLIELVCPSVFRPVDQLLNALLCIWPKEDWSDDEIVSWAAGRVACLFALVLHCKEDAVLSRLEQLDKSEMSAGWDNLITDLNSPQYLFAKFLIRFLQYSAERISHRGKEFPARSSGVAYSEKLLNWSLNFVIHVCQSGIFRKTAVALCELVTRTCAERDSFLELWRLEPFLMIQWCSLLSTLRCFDLLAWKRILSSSQRIPRNLAVLLSCDKIGEYLRRDDLLSAMSFVEMHISDLIHMSSDTPVSDLFRGLCGDPKLCVELVSIIAVELKSKHCGLRKGRKILFLLSSAHLEASGVVLPLLMWCLRSEYFVIGRIASQVACRKLELLLVNRSEETKKLVPVEVVMSFLEGFDSVLARRYGQLYSLMQKLMMSWYSDAVSEIKSQSEFEAELSLLNSPALKFNRLKFIRLVQSLVKRNGFSSSRVLGEILRSCTDEEATEILCTEELHPSLLYACMRMANEQRTDERWSVDGSGNSPDSDEGSMTGRSLWEAGRFALMGRVNKMLRENLPDGSGIVIGSRKYILSVGIEKSMGCDLLGLCKSVSLLLEEDSEQFLSEKDVQLLSRFTLLSLIAVLCCGSDIPMGLCLEAVCCVKCVLCSAEVWEWLKQNEGGVVLQQKLLGALFWVLVEFFHAKGLESILVSLDGPPPFTVPVSSEDPTPFVACWRQISALLNWLDIGFPDLTPKVWPSDARSVIKSAILGVARLPAFCGFTRVPPAAFRYGWTPEGKWEASESGVVILTLPTTPVHQLQNPDVLREFVWRVCWTGWAGRQEFEEVWMALLGVLSATPIGNELQSNPAQETAERIVSSSLAVRCLTALLLQSLLSPVPGNPLKSRYILKHREKPTAFLKTKYGQKLALLKMELRRVRSRTGKVRRNTGNAVLEQDDQLFNANPERTHNSGQFSFGQFSIETLWSLTGILAAERSLVGVGTEPDASEHSEQTEPKERVTELDVAMLDKSLSEGPNGMIFYDDEPPPAVTESSPEKREGTMKKSASTYVMSTNTNLDLVSCLHFLLDLYSHWLRNGCDSVPLPLLSSTVESLVLLSDLFTERGQYEWLRTQLKLVYNSRSQDDELLLQDTMMGLLKAAAVLGVDDSDGQKELVGMIEGGLGNPQLSVRLYTLHGILFLLQSLSSDESWGLIPQVTDFISVEMDAGLAITEYTAVLSRPQSMDYQLVLWSIGMYIAEAYHDAYSRQNFVPKFLDQCRRALTTHTVAIPLLEAVVYGVESLLATAAVDARKQLNKLATEILQCPISSQHTVLAMELLMTCLYSGMEGRCYGDATPDSENPPAMPEPQLSAMEQLTHLFSKVSGGRQLESLAIGKALSGFLTDNFSPGDVMNRVISELLAPTQPNPKILLRVIRSLFESLRELEQSMVVSDWALLSLPTFAHKTPVTLAVSCLSCFLVSAAANPWIRNMFPFLLDRIGFCEQIDKDLFCFIVSGFRHQLEEQSQVKSLILSLMNAGKRHPASVFDSDWSCLS